MNLNTLIWRNLKKNIKHYYLYVFALIFGVALYFSFVTLKFDPALDEAGDSIKGGAAIGASSVLLVVIVAVFLLYANMIFIKRRGREIGLFQLVGLTKGKIFRLLTVENLILYILSMTAGIAAGFAGSRMVLMILFKILEVNEMAKLRFSVEALRQTVIVFLGIYGLIMLMNVAFIKRHSILSLFRVSSVTQERVRRLSVWQVLTGLLGLAGIGFGYYVSSQLFSGRFTSMPELMGAMIFILAMVIGGTYLFYKGSVTFLFNLIRKSKQGYLSVGEALSLSSIMFRMKSNALLLTIITAVSALAIGLLSLSYISYYSAGATARESAPQHFGFTALADKETFVSELEARGIGYREFTMHPLRVQVDASQLMSESDLMRFNDNKITTDAVSEQDVEGMDLAEGEAQLVGFGGAISRFLPLKAEGEISFLTGEDNIVSYMKGITKQPILPYYYGGGSGVFVVDEETFRELQAKADPATLREPGKDLYYGIDLEDRSRLAEATDLYTARETWESSVRFSQYDFELSQRSSMGLIMFIVGFLGLTFLVTSGCILYFKQMDEAQEEQGSYTILRKLGFTKGDLMQGIRLKQLFNFGIPLAVGLSHSYFAVKSGWFFFGTEMLTPMFLVMGLYTVLYSIFGLLSVLHYKRVVSESL